MAKKQSMMIGLKAPRPGASEEALERFERESGIKIPPEYRRFLACQNGGSPVKRSFTCGKGAYQDSVLRSFFGVNCPRAYDLSFILKQYSGRIPPHTFPIASDEFDNLIMISRRRGSANQILFWDHE